MGKFVVPKDKKLKVVNIDLKRAVRINKVVLNVKKNSKKEQVVGITVELIKKDGTLIAKCGKVTVNKPVVSVSCRNRVASIIRVKSPSGQVLALSDIDIFGVRVKRSRKRRSKVRKIGKFVVPKDKKVNALDIDLSGSVRVENVVLNIKKDSKKEKVIGISVQLVKQDGTLIAECGKVTENKPIVSVSCENRVASIIRIKGPSGQELVLSAIDVFGVQIRKLKRRKTKARKIGNFVVPKNKKINALNIDLTGSVRIRNVVLKIKKNSKVEKMVGVTVELVKKDGTLIAQCGKVTVKKPVISISCRNRVASKIRIKSPSGQELELSDIDVFGEHVKKRKTSKRRKSKFRKIRNFVVPRRRNIKELKIDLRGSFKVGNVVLRIKRRRRWRRAAIGITVQLVKKDGTVIAKCRTLTKRRRTFTISCGYRVASYILIKSSSGKRLAVSSVDVYGDDAKIAAAAPLGLRKFGNYDISTFGKLKCFVINVEVELKIGQVVINYEIGGAKKSSAVTSLELLTGENKKIGTCTKISGKDSVTTFSCGKKIAQKIRFRGSQGQLIEVKSVDIFEADVPISEGAVEKYVRKDQVDKFGNYVVADFESLKCLIINLERSVKIGKIVLNHKAGDSGKKAGPTIELLSANNKAIGKCKKISGTESTSTISCDKKIGHKIRFRASKGQILKLTSIDVFGVYST